MRKVLLPLCLVLVISGIVWGASSSVTSKIGLEDLNIWRGGSDSSTFSRRTSTGGSLTLTKVNLEASPIEYGAKCDDSTDDTAAFTAAINAVGVGGVVSIPNANCKVNLVIADKPITLRGSAGNWTYWNFQVEPYALKPYDPTKPVIHVYSTSYKGAGPVIQDVAVLGNKSTDQTGIHLGPGCASGNLSNIFVGGFIEDNILIGDDTAMAAPITAINIENFVIVPMNSLGNGIRIALPDNPAVTTNAWITAINLNHGIIDTAYINTGLTNLKFTTWSGGTDYPALSTVIATDDHVNENDGDNGTSDWGYIWQTASSCTSDSTEPTWGTTVGGTTSDNTCTWVNHQRGRAILMKGLNGPLGLNNVYIGCGNFAGIRIEGVTFRDATPNYTPFIISNGGYIDSDNNGTVLENRIDYDYATNIFGKLFNLAGKVKNYSRSTGRYTRAFLPHSDTEYNHIERSSEALSYNPTSYGRHYFGYLSPGSGGTDSNPYSDPGGYISSESVGNLWINSTADGNVTINANNTSGHLQLGTVLGGKYNTTHLIFGSTHMFMGDDGRPWVQTNYAPDNSTDGDKLMYLLGGTVYPDSLTFLETEIITDNSSAQTGTSSNITMTPYYTATKTGSEVEHYYLALVEPTDLSGGKLTINNSYLFSSYSGGTSTLIDAATGGADGWVKITNEGLTQYIPVFTAKSIGSTIATVSGTPTPGYLAKFDSSGNVILDGVSATAPSFATASLSTPRPTAGSGTGVTVNDAGSLRTQVYKVTVAYTNFISAAVNHDLTLGTLPAKSVVHSVIADVTVPFVCSGTCTTATLSATVGITAGGTEFLESFDIDNAAATFGDTDAEVGSKLDVAGATNSGYVSWASCPLVMRAVSGTGNWGDGADTFLSAGSITFYVLYSVMP